MVWVHVVRLWCGEGVSCSQTVVWCACGHGHVRRWCGVGVSIVLSDCGVVCMWTRSCQTAVWSGCLNCVVRLWCGVHVGVSVMVKDGGVVWVSRL